jgi:hypothetical protein
MKTLGMALGLALLVGCAAGGDEDVADALGAGTGETATTTEWEGPWSAFFAAGDQSITYKLTVTGAEVRIDADGFQTQTRLVGMGKVEGDELAVSFVRCGSRQPKPKQECAQFKLGDELVRFTKEGKLRKLSFGKLVIPADAAGDLFLTPNWDGTWQGTATAGNAFIDYKLTIKDFDVKLTSVGTQTDEALIGLPFPDGSTFAVQLKECTKSNCQLLAKGDQAFSLVRKGKETFLQFDKLISLEGVTSIPITKK